MTGLRSGLADLLERRRLTPSQRRIGQYVLEHPREVVFLDGSELAVRAGVSQPSVSRFAQALGFRGYPEFARHLRALATEDPGRRDRGLNRFQAAIAAEIGNLEALQEAVADAAAIEALGARLAASVPLAVLGLRSSRAAASSFAFFAAKVHPGVRAITEGGSAAAEALDQVRAAGGTHVLAFALPRCPRETVAALAHAREIGCEVVLVAESRLSPARGAGEELLAAGVGQQLVFDSQAAPAALAAVLLDALAAAEPARTQARLDDFERAALARGYFAEATTNGTG
jgi:DNA-binding MurR/RpiR family transcriptional regulator